MELKQDTSAMHQGPLSTVSRQVNFFVQELKDHDWLAPCLEYSPVRLFHFEFIWVIKGSGWLMIDAEKVSIQDNVIYCLSPGQVRRFVTAEVSKGYYLVLSPDLYYSVQGQVDYSFFGVGSDIPRNTVLVIPGEQVVCELNVILELIIQKHKRNSCVQEEIFSTLLKIFLLYLSSNAREKESVGTFGNEEKITRRFIELVKSNFISMKQVTDYATKMNLSPNYLSCTVKKVSGFSAGYYIRQCIVLEAKRQAMSGHTTLKETARSLGFSDCAHFSKYFKINCGINFSHYRKRLASESSYP